MNTTKSKILWVLTFTNSKTQKNAQTHTPTHTHTQKREIVIFFLLLKSLLLHSYSFTHQNSIQLQTLYSLKDCTKIQSFYWEAIGETFWGYCTKRNQGDESNWFSIDIFVLSTFILPPFPLMTIMWFFGRFTCIWQN